MPFAPNADVYETGYYRKMYQPHWFLRNRRKYEERDAALLRIVKPTPELRLLELGSARGDSSFFFAPLVKEVVGIDASGTAVAIARELAARDVVPNVRFEVADARDLAAFPDASFDVVLLADFVEHVEDDVLTASLREGRRVLTPGGALAIYTPNLDHWAERLKDAIPGLQQKDHIAVRRSARVVQFVRDAGFSVADLFFSASPYPLFGALDRLFASRDVCRFRTCLRASR